MNKDNSSQLVASNLQLENLHLMFAHALQRNFSRQTYKTNTAA